MKFLLLPKNGKPRFSNKDPWEYIKSKRMKPVKDYFNFYYDIDISKNSGINGLRFIKSPYGIIYFNQDGNNIHHENLEKENINKLATAFYNAYGAVYEKNMRSIFSNCLIVKTYDYENIEDMNNQDIKELKRMLKDAIKWF